MPELLTRLLHSDCRTPLRDKDLTCDERNLLVKWRKQKFCRLMRGPGPDWWIATKHGRVELSDQEWQAKQEKVYDF